MGILTIAAVLWDANEKSLSFSRCYDESWALKLFNGFRRNLTIETRCVLFTDRRRNLPPNIEQIIDPATGENGYGDCIRPFMLDEPMIFAGLDTIVVGNCDKFARWCFESDRIALPRHPYEPDVPINGVVFCPAGMREIYDRWQGENDMEWLRGFPNTSIDALWPRRVISFKAHVGPRRDDLPNGARICYFHGRPKPHDLSGVPWVRQHWR